MKDNDYIINYYHSDDSNVKIVKMPSPMEVNLSERFGSSEQRCTFQCRSLLVSYVFIHISHASFYSPGRHVFNPGDEGGSVW